MMRYLILLFCFIFSLSHLAYGSNFSLISDMGATAQSIALGNIEGSSRSADAIFSNPAGLYRVRYYSLSLFQTTVMNDINYLNASLCKNTAFGKFGIGYYLASVNDIPFTAVDTNNDEFIIKEKFSYKNTVAKLAYQKKITRRLHVGLTYSKYKVSFHEITGNGYGLDFGLLRIFRYFTFSTFIQNLNQGSINYSNASDPTYHASEKLPLSVSTSLRYPLFGMIFYPQIKYYNNNFLPSIGIQYKPIFMPFLKFNVGYRQLLDYSNQIHSKSSLGFDLKLLTLTFQYAYERSEYILQDHISYFSLTYNFKINRGVHTGPLPFLLFFAL